MHEIAVDVPEEDRADLATRLADHTSTAASGSSGGGLALDPEQLKVVVDSIEGIATVVSTVVTTWLAIRTARSSAITPPEESARVVLELATRDVEVPIVDGKPQLPDDVPQSARELLRISLR